MKTQKTQLKEIAAQYGLKALNDSEIIEMVGYKGSDFFNSQEFKAMKEIVSRHTYQDLVRITTSKDIYNLMSHLEGQDHEEFWAVYLNNNNKVLKSQFVSKGALTGTLVNVQEIVREALNVKKCSGVILCHNHPSGNLKPSNSDTEITTKVKSALTLFDIKVLDHVIIGNGGYFSFTDEGIL